MKLENRSDSVERFVLGGGKLVIAWNGLPVYGAWQIRAVKNFFGEALSVVATRPDVPARGMEEIIGSPVHWIDPHKQRTWSEIGLEIPDVYIQTGWAYPYFNCLGAEVRAAGGIVIAMVDNCWKGNLRQWLGAVKYRLHYKKWFWGVIVPGRSGAKFCRFLGVPGRRVFRGLYACNRDVFFRGGQLSLRPKKIIFVGRLIERKGIREFSEAWQQFHIKNSDWTCEVYGRGPLSELINSTPGMILNDFAPEAQIAEAMRSSRVLVLPSWEEHWGVVVHEAVSSGCALILSDAVGSLPDFLSSLNGYSCKVGSSSSLREALFQINTWGDQEWEAAERASVLAADESSPALYAKSCIEIVGDLYN